MSIPGNLKKKLIAAAAICFVLTAGLGAANAGAITRLYKAVTLFDSAVITENFRSMGSIFNTRTIHRGESIFKFKRGSAVIPSSYEYRGNHKLTDDFLKRTKTTGLLVFKDDTILYEQYFNGNNESSKCISWSVCKSFVSALFGIAVSEGYIRSIEQKVTDYLPELKGSGYSDVRIKDVLQMSSGVGFNEDYGDFNSDINKLGRSFAINTPVVDLIQSLKQQWKPGTYNHYVSMDTQILGMLICAATGRTLASYMEEKLWKPLGMESDALWLVDGSGMEIAFGGLNVILRDYARFGRLYLNNGMWNGKQVVPASWVKASITPDAPHLMPGKRTSASHPMGYGFQWWVPEKADGAFMAIGIYGQAIYINPKQNVVIVKTSAYADYTKDDDMENEEAEMFKTIAKSF